MKTVALLSLVGLMAAPAMAQVNGSLTPAYGSAVSVQTNATGFGDANQGDIDFTNGSELNAAFYRSDATYAYLLFTGNLETNYNKLEVFFSTGAAGQQQISGGVPAMGNINGFRHDNGFNANLWISVTNGASGTPSAYSVFVDAAQYSGGVWTGGYQGTNNGQNGGSLAGGGSLTGGALLVGTDNSNTLGVIGTGNPTIGNPLSATTGIEIAVPWAALGLAPGSSFDVMAFVNGSSHDYASNQFLAPLPAGTGNLGGDNTGGYNGSVGAIDMTRFAGNQFFTVPTPAAAGVFGLAGLAAFRRRR
jgi:hypothetical protein